MHVILLTNDLMFTSKIEGALRNFGAKLLVANDSQGAINSATDEDAALIMIDLATPNVDLPQFVKSLPEGCQTVAYGPHVHEARLAAARNAGCGIVVSRGELDRRLNGILEQILT